MTTIPTSPRVLILHSDRFLGELLRHCIQMWGDARVEVFEEVSEALNSIEADKPALLIAELNVDDMIQSEHLQACDELEVPLLLLTSGRDESSFNLLRQVRFDGLFDAASESLDSFRLAMTEAMNRQFYVSATLVPYIARCSA